MILPGIHAPPDPRNAWWESFGVSLVLVRYGPTLKNGPGSLILTNLDNPDAFLLLKQWRVNITLVIIFILDIVNSIHPVQNLLEQIMANSLHFKLF